MSFNSNFAIINRLPQGHRTYVCLIHDYIYEGIGDCFKMHYCIDILRGVLLVNILHFQQKKLLHTEVKGVGRDKTVSTYILWSVRDDKILFWNENEASRQDALDFYLISYYVTRQNYIHSD